MASAKTDLLSVPVDADETALPCATGLDGTDDIPTVYVQELRTLLRYLYRLSARVRSTGRDLFFDTDGGSGFEKATLGGHPLKTAKWKTLCHR